MGNLCPFHDVWDPDCELCEVDTVNGSAAEISLREEDAVVEEEQPPVRAARREGVWTGQGALPLEKE